MKFFKRYIFPAVFGLMVYFTVRLLHDIEYGEKFWKRSWTTNSIEMGFSILTGYISVNLFEKLFKYYDKRWPLQFSYKGIVREAVIMVLANLLLVNLILTPMAALTDDGLSWADIVDIWTIPSLYAIIYYGIARSSSYMKAYVDNKLQLEKLTNDHLATELKFLKSQYHPHFLFNALNTIYFQMDEDVAAAKQSIEKFSELLRYQLYDQQKTVPIASELEYLQSFIALQKTRISDKLQLTVEFDKMLNTQQIYPLLFLPLVENAFKFIGGQYMLMIQAKLSDNHIIFGVKNSVPDIVPTVTASSGIGLENLKRRLELLYPGKYSLVTGKEHDSYIAEITLIYE